ncbi:MAG: insulinase family protein [Clostridia bacterium]|nr:insulinase family protein [Clostridia bacterium]
MIQQAKLTNGIRVIMEPMDTLRSVSIGVWVNAGSVYETGADAGISHFIEHMVFKGTARRSAADIAAEMDAVGGNLNAFTAKECTCFYAKVLDEDLPLAVDMLSDITLHPALDEQEMEKEKRVVIEEILMSEDSPEDKAFETAGAAYYSGTVLSSAILGTEKTVSAFTRDQVLSYMARRYVSGNMVIACAGSFVPERLLSLLEESFADCPRGSGDMMGEKEPRAGKRWLFVQKDTEQVNACLMLPGFRLDSSENFALAVLSNALGGSMSSRLFQKIREELGLAYSVYTYPMAYRNTGAICLYFGSGEKQATRTLELALRELDRLKGEGLSEAELIRSRAQLKGSFLLGMEGSGAHMNAIGKRLLLQNKEFTIEDTLSAIECVTMEKVNGILSRVLSPRRAVCAAVGRTRGVKADMTALLDDWMGRR